MTDHTTTGAVARWRDTSLSAQERIEALIGVMTLREKLGQLYAIWVGASPTGGADVAPFQHEMHDGIELEDLLPNGLGQLTRPFGTAPIDAAVGLVSLARTQRRIMEANRLGLPALAHEECLAGFTAWGATAYPVPLSWGATFNPELIESMAARIGAGMRSVGVHQGLAPVLDVVRDLRWGRVEETAGEDPYLVGTITSAYVRGLEGAGIIATLKHFAGYSASKAARNLAPVSMGSREYNDVILAPFEMAVRESGVRSVMHAYTDVDGVPSASNRELLTGLLRERWGFTGTVVADYFGVNFLLALHRVVGTLGEAAAAALSAGVDVELPTVKAYGEPLAAEIEAGRFDELFVDQALRRVLAQKLQLGMLDPDWDPLPEGWAESDLGDIEAVRGRIDLDTDADRELARHVAEQAAVLLSNDGTLPLAADTTQRILVTGPTADDPFTHLGCYSFPGHVGTLHPEVPVGIEIPTMLEGLRAEFRSAQIDYVPGVTVDGNDSSAIDEAVARAAQSDVIVTFLGDRSGLFGRGTSGEGCDAETLRLPGLQQEFLECLLDTGKPVIVVLVEGRAYALGTAPDRASAIIASFLPGEEGGTAIAGILSGRVEPSGRLPVSVPASPYTQPSTYLMAPLAAQSGTTNIDPTPRYPFGHGLTYTSFQWSDLTVNGEPAVSVPLDAPIEEVVPSATTATDDSLAVGLTVLNAGQRPGVEVVQLYLHDPVASVVRPLNRLIGYARVPLDPGQSARVSFEVPADVTAFTGRSGEKIVEPGAIQLRLGASSGDLRLNAAVELTGQTRVVDHTRRLHCAVKIGSEQ